jgi:C1A family cysteine protease
MATHHAVDSLNLVTHRTQVRFGWRPDLPDHRDQVYSAPPPPAQGLPGSVDLRPHCPPVYDQGQLGRCTANAIAGLIEFDRKKQNLSDFVPSRLFIYYNERVMEGTVGEDAGAEIRDGIKSVAKIGGTARERLVLRHLQVHQEAAR